MDYAPLFVEIADAYFERELYAEARPIYETLGSDANVRSYSHVAQHVSQPRRRVVFTSFYRRPPVYVCWTS